MTQPKLTPKQSAFIAEYRPRRDIVTIDTTSAPRAAPTARGGKPSEEAHMHNDTRPALHPDSGIQPDFAERFWKRVTIGQANECWPWNGAKDLLGYGRVRHDRQARLAHRIAHRITTSEEPEAVCHTCDNPSCCNPAHLFSGTRLDNNRDMVRKGRHASQTGTHWVPLGEAHHQAKLTDDDVLTIRRQYKQGGYTQRQLARDYGVSQRTITKVVNRIGWRHV